jgi:hypothetical protein
MPDAGAPPSPEKGNGANGATRQSVPLGSRGRGGKGGGRSGGGGRGRGGGDELSAAIASPKLAASGAAPVDGMDTATAGLKALLGVKPPAPVPAASEALPAQSPRTQQPKQKQPKQQPKQQPKLQEREDAAPIAAKKQPGPSFSPALLAAAARAGQVAVAAPNPPGPEAAGGGAGGGGDGPSLSKSPREKNGAKQIDDRAAKGGGKGGGGKGGGGKGGGGEGGGG